MIAWTIAGSDSGGGAGIQADLETFADHGVHGCSVITALTAQNTQAVRAVELTSPQMIRAQIDALSEDLPAKAIKTGMLGNAVSISCVAEALENLDCFYVCDPVMVATSGGALMESEAHQTLIKQLMPRVDLLTPNLPEARALCGQEINGPPQIEDCARKLLEMGARSVLIKGGHGNESISSDYWTDGQRAFWLHTPRLETSHTHGSGCTLSAAITALIASGLSPTDALVLGKAYVTRAIRKAVPLGKGFGPVVQSGPPHAEDMPWLTPGPDPSRPSFPDCGSEPLGLYPLVNRASWLEALLPVGVRTIQLRIKDLNGEALEEEINKSVAVAREYDARLFINDHWREAIKAGAYGVHLGQEDLTDVAIKALAEAGLRIGISTHDYTELARAQTYNPSYVALGPIFTTTSKKLEYQPQGLEKIQTWKRLNRAPIVAIGGIQIEHIEKIMAAGAGGIAVIGGIMAEKDPQKQAQNWLKRLVKNG